MNKLELVNKKVVLATFKTFYKAWDISYIPNDYKVVVERYFSGFRDTFKFDRYSLQNEFDFVLDEYECYMDDNNKWYDKFDRDDLENFNKEFCKAVLPVWQDKAKKWCNIGSLAEHYDLDLDELYFDGDSNCIRDKEGNVWYD